MPLFKDFMPRIKIDNAPKKPKVPPADNLNKTVPRFRPAGGPVPLPIDKSYNRQGDK